MRKIVLPVLALSMAAALYPIGYGLSYTGFRYSELSTGTASVRADGTVNVSVRVTDTGARAGDEVDVTRSKPLSPSPEPKIEF